MPRLYQAAQSARPGGQNARPPRGGRPRRRLRTDLNILMKTLAQSPALACAGWRPAGSWCKRAGRRRPPRTDPVEHPNYTLPCVRRVASGGQLVQAGGKKAAATRRPAAEAGEARAAALRVLIAEDNAINMKARPGRAPVW